MPRFWIRSAVFAAALLAAPVSEAGAQGLTRAYVVDRSATTMRVTDVRGSGLRKTIDLGAPPYDVVVAGDRVFVSLPSVNQVAVIDPVSLTVVGSIAVPGGPRDLDRVTQALVPRLFISTDAGLRIYDWSTGTLFPPVDVGPGQAKVLDVGPPSSGRPVFVAACDGGPTVRVFDDLGGTVSAAVPTGPAPCAVLSTPEGVYVATSDGTLALFSPTLSNPQFVGSFMGPVALAEGSTGVWVASTNGPSFTYRLSLIPRPPHDGVSVLLSGRTPAGIATTQLPGVGEVVIVALASGNVDVMSPTGTLLYTTTFEPGLGAMDVGESHPADPVAAPSDGSWTDAQGVEPAMNLDSRFVAFSSAASTLVAGDTNGLPDVFVRDRLLRRTARVSVTSAGGEAVGPPSPPRAGSYAPALSGDGRYVLFLSLATNLVAGDTNGREDIFLHDRDVDADGLFDEPGQVGTRRVSVQSDGSDATCRAVSPSACAAPGIQAAFSRGGRHVVFSTILEFDAADVNGLPDVFAIDLTGGRTTRLSQRPGGLPGAGAAQTPVVSGDGRFVAFRTSDAGMVTYDTNGVDDVYALDRDPDGNGVFDEQAPAFTHVSLQPGGALYTTPSMPVAFSEDGRWVGYASQSTLAIFDRALGHNALVRSVGMPVVGTGQFSPDARYLSAVGFGSAATLIRVDRDTDADGIRDEPGAVEAGPIALIRWDGGAVATDASARLAAVSVLGQVGGLGVRDVLGPPAWPPYDIDGDGLENGFELRFNLDPGSAFGPEGADGDLDGDGRTNLQEQLAGTHPRSLVTRYLAEGATGSFFSTRMAVANPGSRDVRVLLRYQTDTGHSTSTYLAFPPLSRRFVDVGSVPSLASASFSTVIEADGPIAVDRTMLWASGFYGSTAETSVASPSPTWFLAEGATHGAFDLFYLLQNPSATAAAAVEIRYLRTSGPPIVRTYTVPPARRLTVYVDDVPGLDAADVSAAISSTNAVPIIVERAMYYTRPGQPFAAGHASAGVTATATQWFLAEGATGTFFDLFLLLANPSSDPADIRISYLRPNGAPIVKTRTLPPTSRTTIHVEQEDPALLDTAVSTVVESLNAVGVVVERAMWWPASGGWQEAHNSPGATVAAPRWVFGDGEVGNPPFNTRTFFLIANTSAQTATVRVTLLLDGAAAVSRTFTVPAHSRFNVPVGNEFPEAAGRGFGAVVESIDATPVPIVVERAMYSDAGGVVWAAGTDALGTPIP